MRVSFNSFKSITTVISKFVLVPAQFTIKLTEKPSQKYRSPSVAKTFILFRQEPSRADISTFFPTYQVKANYMVISVRECNNSVMEMLIMAYACKTSSARKVVGVIPYLPYSRQCKHDFVNLDLSFVFQEWKASSLYPRRKISL